MRCRNLAFSNDRATQGRNFLLERKSAEEISVADGNEIRHAALKFLSLLRAELGVVIELKRWPC
jgi:hypothetical protein